MMGGLVAGWGVGEHGTFQKKTKKRWWHKINDLGPKSLESWPEQGREQESKTRGV